MRDKVKRLAWRREYAAKNREKQRAWFKKWYYSKWEAYYKKNKVRIAENLERSRSPLKDKARMAVNWKLKTGQMVRGRCEVCGAQNAQGHHPDYNKPLDVRWLCPQHHKQLHVSDPHLLSNN